MRYREAHRPAWLTIAALLGVARAAPAQNDTVRVTCAALTLDDAAQVEARTRATLLTNVDASLSVRIECVEQEATVVAVAGERTESTRLTLPADNAREALLSAVERTLEALERPGAVLDGDRSPPPANVPAASSKPVAVTAPQTESAGPVPPARKHRAPTWQLGAAVLGELWQGAIGLGAGLVVERRSAPWFLGARFAWLTPSGQDDAFHANEFHASAFGAFEEERVTGVRGALGVGISVLTVAPAADLVTHSATTLPIGFVELGLSRPVRFGHAWLLPGLDVRLFPSRREVIVDSTRHHVLPPVCPSLFFGVGYEL